MSATKVETRAAERAADKLSRERRIQQVRPGWWVFSYTQAGFGSWGKVEAVAAVTDPATGRAATRLSVLNPASGQRHEIQHPNGYPAWCCTSADARQAGLA